MIDPIPPDAVSFAKDSLVELDGLKMTVFWARRAPDPAGGGGGLVTEVSLVYRGRDPVPSGGAVERRRWSPHQTDEYHHPDTRKGLELAIEYARAVSTVAGLVRSAQSGE